jgi:hypothetical protein
MYRYVTRIPVCTSPPRQEHVLLLPAESISSGPRRRPRILLPSPLVHKQASSLLDGLLWKLAYICIDSSWMLADDEDRWILAREARTVHALVLLKPLHGRRREGWLSTTPARSVHGSGRCALLELGGDGERHRVAGNLPRKGQAAAA